MYCTWEKWYRNDSIIVINIHDWHTESWKKKKISQDSLQFCEKLSTLISHRNTFNSNNLKWLFSVWLHQPRTSLWRNSGPLVFIALLKRAVRSFMHSSHEVSPWHFNRVEVWAATATPGFFAFSAILLQISSCALDYCSVAWDNFGQGSAVGHMASHFKSSIQSSWSSHWLRGILAVRYRWTSPLSSRLSTVPQVLWFCSYACFQT